MSRLRSLLRKLEPSKRRKVTQPEKKALGFYSSPEWLALMESIKRSRGNACEDPLHDESRPRTASRIYGDHIRELKDGGPSLDPQNIMLRCPSCHQRKTAVSRSKRYGVGV